MIYTQTNGTIQATNTAQRLTGAVASGTRIAATWIMVQAVSTNGGDLYIGGANPASKQTSLVSQTNKVGIRLVAGAMILFPVVSTTTPYDLNETWISGTANDTYSVTYLVR